jgi:hypothetical protein
MTIFITILLDGKALTIEFNAFRVSTIACFTNLIVLKIFRYHWIYKFEKNNNY